MAKTTAERLQAARDETITSLGIGGHLQAPEFLKAFSEIDATRFAEIMYATDQMDHDFAGSEALNPAHLPTIINAQDFAQKPHFQAVADVFRKHFGDQTARRDPAR